jgi:hypothetical protein
LKRKGTADVGRDASKRQQGALFWINNQFNIDNFWVVLAHFLWMWFP